MLRHRRRARRECDGEYMRGSRHRFGLLTCCRMSKVSDTYKWEDMCDLTPEDMEHLLLFYPANKVPSMDVLKALRGGNAKSAKDFDVFDGSFGFSI